MVFFATLCDLCGFAVHPVIIFASALPFRGNLLHCQVPESWVGCVIPVNQPLHPLLRYAALAGFLLLTFCAPLPGVLSPPGDWYASLAKPTWNPPAWLFGPVWTALYLMMAVAAWLVWTRRGWCRALWIYLAQLLLNAAWTPIFFGAREIGWAFVAILALWMAIVCTVLAFLRVSKAAGWMLVPYLAWVSFAAFLNFTLWRLNQG